MSKSFIIKKFVLPVIQIFFVFLLCLFCGCFSVKSVSIGKIQDFKLDNFTLQTVSFSMKVPIKNPNNFKIKIAKVKLNASLDNKEIAKVSKVNSIIIPANSDGVHDVKVTLEFIEKIAGLSDYYKLYQKKALFKFNGFVKARSFLIGKKIQIEDKNLFKMLNN